MNRILVNWLILVIAVVITTKLLPGGIRYNGSADLPFREVAIFAVILGLVNALVSPVIKVLTFPITMLTLGVFSLVVNALMFWLAAGIVHFEVGFITAFVAAIIVSVVNTILSRIL